MKIIELDSRELTNEYTFISDGTWYIEGAKCELEINCVNGGIFRGPRLAQDDAEIERHGIGVIYDDGENCGFDEFHIYDANGNKVKLI